MRSPDVPLDVKLLWLVIAAIGLVLMVVKVNETPSPEHGGISYQSFKDLSSRVDNQGKLIERLDGMVSALQREGRK